MKPYWLVLKCFFIVIGITINSGIGLKAQILYPDVFEDKVYSKNIQTVLLREASWELALPVIELNKDQQLELRFDELSDVRHNYAYTLVHCDVNWKKSGLTIQEYLSGYGEGTIKEVASSFNTTFEYTHYRLVFPEEDCLPVVSGNFALVVWDEDDPDKMVLTRRLYIAESVVKINAKIRQPTYGTEKSTSQQIHFTILHDNSEIHDPVNEITAVIFQNNRPDNKMILKKPFSIIPGQMDYTDPESGIFMAGNEFRSLDIKSTKYQTQNIASITFQNPYFHFIMKPDQSRSNSPYFSKTDLNGGYYIDMEQANNKHIDADYVYVHFNLNLPYLYTTDVVYVTGEFCDWTLTENNKMHFNEEKQLFAQTMLLKQGLYDYCFVKNNEETGRMDEYEVEGSFYETENDYTIYIYFHDRQKNCDRLLGFKSIK